MDIQASIYNALCLTGLAFLIYRTDAIYHYGKAIGLSRFNFWRVFQLSYIGRPDSLQKLTPLEYIRFIWGDSNFIAALIGCPYCLFFWVSVFASKFNVGEALSSYCVYIFLYKAVTKF